MTAELVIGPRAGTRRVARMGDLMRALIRRPDGLIGLVILAFFTILAVSPEFFVGELQTAVTGQASGNPRLAPPSDVFLLGTDEKRREMLNVTVHGARVSMVIGLLATVITVVVGAVVGIVSGFVGGRLDALLMRITDFFLVIPTFILALILTQVIREVIGSGSQELFGIRMTLIVIVIVIGITSWSSTGHASWAPAAATSCGATSCPMSST
jgi:peptide/nickel transport system permease protein